MLLKLSFYIKKQLSQTLEQWDCKAQVCTIL